MTPVATAQRITPETCHKDVTFAVIENESLVYRLPRISEQWLARTQKKFSGMCFSQLRNSNGGDKHYLVVLSTYQAAFNGLLPVLRKNTTTDSTPVFGSGTVADNYGSTWYWTYQGRVTTTTVRTTETRVPYTDMTTHLYATAYNEAGTSIGTAEKSATFREGGDAANTLGYNLASMLMSRNNVERLIEDILKQINTRPSSIASTEVRATKPSVPERDAPQPSSGLRRMIEDGRRYIALHPEDSEARPRWSELLDVYCRLYPDANYVGLDGNTMSCGGWAKQAFGMMEKLRRDIAELERTKSEGKEGFSVWAIDQAKSSWAGMQKVYCESAPGGAYIDLEGKTQTCRTK